MPAVNPVIFVILAGMVGAVALLSIVSTYIDVAFSSWAQAAREFPEQPKSEVFSDGRARLWVVRRERFEKWANEKTGCLAILLFPITLFRWAMRWGGAINCRFALDEQFLHIDYDGGTLGATGNMSVPLAEVQHLGTGETHLGVFDTLDIGPYIIQAPARVFAEELAVRARLDEPVDPTEAPAQDIIGDDPPRLPGDDRA
ncbi:MAG: hypothetical protein AAGD00_02620 [Planctomycetota bacterium]